MPKGMAGYSLLYLCRPGGSFDSFVVDLAMEMMPSCNSGIDDLAVLAAYRLRIDRCLSGREKIIPSKFLCSTAELSG